MPAWAISLGIAGGSMALQYLFRPRVKQQPVDKGKMDDVRITSSDYGAFMPRFWGQARFGGNVIWSNGVQHYIIDTPSSGGKGGPSAPAERTHVYKTSLGVLLCRRAPTRSEAITNILRLWADADLLIGNGVEQYTGLFEAENGTLAGGATVVDPDTTASAGKSVTNLGSGGKVTFNVSSVPAPPRPRPNDPEEVALLYTRISFFYKSTTDLTVDVVTNNGSGAVTETYTFPDSFDEWTTKTVFAVGSTQSIVYERAGSDCPDLDKVTLEKYWEIVRGPLERGVPPSYNVTGVVNENIAYPSDLDDPSEYYNYFVDDAKDAGTGIYSLSTPVPGEDRRVYSGTETQTQDSAIMAWLDTKYGSGEGSLRASAHRGLAYILFENYTMRQARVPNFTVELSNGLDDLNDCLEDLFADVNLETTDYDITATDGLTQIGILESQGGSRKAFIESLARYHQFRLAEIDGKIYTVVDNGTSVGTIAQTSLRAHGENEECPAHDAQIIVKEEHLLPREVRFSVMNPTLDYHNETAAAMLFGSMVATETKEFAFPIIDPLLTAREKAERWILKEYSEDKAFEFFGMPETAKYSIGDVVEVEIAGATHLIRVEKMQVTLPLGKIRFQGVSTGYIYTDVEFQSDTTESSPRTDGQSAIQMFPRNTVVVPILSKPILEKHKGRLGVYLAISGRGRGAGENSSLYRELTEDNYQLEFVVDSSTPMGIVPDAVPTWVDENTLDETSEVDIEFFDDVELESISEADADRMPTANLIRIGDEWIQFLTATAQTLSDASPYRSKWTISDLRRGRFATDAAMSTHADGEYGSLVTHALRFFDLGPEDIGEVVRFKGVTAGQSVEVAPISEVAPFSPVDGDYTIANVATTRTLDCDATDLDELADVVGTLIQDLRRD